MYQCELFSIQQNTADAEALKASRQKLASVLDTDGVELKNITDIPADPKKLDDAVSKLLADGDRDMFIFANALNTTDSSSFRKLFYRMIGSIESSIQVDESRKDL